MITFEKFLSWDSKHALKKIKLQYDPSQDDMNQTDNVSSSKDLEQEIAEGAF